jgi:Flp pilus assembly protein TadG
MWKRNLQRKTRQPGGRRREKGLQLVEMALVMPVMLLLLGGIVELSYYFYTYATLARATRAGAGYIYTKAFVTTEIDKAKNMVVCGELNSCSGYKSLVPNLTAANVSVTLTTLNAVDKTVTVQINNYSYTPLFNLVALTNNKVAKWDTSVTKIPAATTMRYTGDR